MAQTISLPNIDASATLGTMQVHQIERTGLAASMHSDLNNIFFATSDFAIVASYSDLHSTYNVKGIFDENFENLNLSTSTSAVSVTPVFTAMASKFRKKPINGDFIKIQGRKYEVVTVHPDGVGTVTLNLKRCGR